MTSGIGASMVGRLMLYDARDTRFDQLLVRWDPKIHSMDERRALIDPCTTTIEWLATQFPQKVLQVH